MGPLNRIAHRLGIRPDETRNVSLSFLGAFLVIAFLVFARSIREALYLDAFDVKTLPYITAAVALASVPTVTLFARLLARYPPKGILAALVVVLALGLGVLWPFATRVDVGVVAFYLWTELGTLLLTSGFWVVTSEYFALRGAKRLYGLIGAGGTAGAMVMGNSLVWLTPRVDFFWLVPLLAGLLGLFFIIIQLLPEIEYGAASDGEPVETSSLRESFALVFRSPHLRLIGMIVFTATVATTLLDYQFKELLRAAVDTKEQLASFFGAFYGWTGAVAFFLQIAVVARLMTFSGIAMTLAVLPLFLLFGSVGMLLAPSLILVTLVRGADSSLRKSTHRSPLEVLFVPVASLTRRKTKTFIDSVMDSVAEGVGAGIVLLWVTLSGFPSRYLSVFVIMLAGFFLLLSRRMGRQYFTTVTERLEQSGGQADMSHGTGLEGRDLLSGTFTRIDIASLLEGDDEPSDAEEPPVEIEEVDSDVILSRLQSPDLTTVARTLENTIEWDEAHVPVLARLLARDSLVDRVVFAFTVIGERAVPHLSQLLSDESTDFVIRRRVPRVLSKIGAGEAEDTLIRALAANRFEVRYRAAIALVKRRRRGLPQTEGDIEPAVWEAVRSEANRDQPVWELQKLLDDAEGDDDDVVARRVGVRGELSLEHTFRLLSLILDPAPVRAAFNGVVLDDQDLKDFSLEYLEQVLPSDIRSKLWPFIGDVSEYQRERSARPLGEVVSDLMSTGATLFADEGDRAALKRILEDEEA